ncbi:ead/Ea22-like family protein [Salmonella enterica subsp. enterica serovar Brunei]|nr:hypothetical protein [Salmonella enterica subsp. enterica serovar Brunei]EBX8596714.1 hypothetical protein [Salmonella enterica subsp. enterica serovar Brunei]ECZ3663266.1 ead/Ea22-like family protein [Salmonella enterica subsp. enterica serovar Brunei]
MTALNKQALLRAAVKIGAEKWTHDGNGEVTTEEYTADGQALVDLICNCEVVGTSSPRAEFISMANPATILVLLDELEAANELVELQRFKLERQAEDLHQAKSLESIHREKRLEAEREFRDYKDRAESNQMRLAKDVCRLEDELQAAGIGVKGE